MSHTKMRSLTGTPASRRRIPTPLLIVLALVGVVVGEPLLRFEPARAGTFFGDNGVIAFASAGSHGVHIFTVCPDGTGLHRVIRTPRQGVSAYSDWSPDGRTLAFDSDRKGNVDLYLRRPDGDIRQLTHNRAGDSHPTWTPSGRRIAFESDRSGRKQIFTVPMRAGRVRQITHYGPGAEEPAYSPTGKWIAFLSGKVGRTALFVVRPSGKGLHQLTRRRMNAGHPSWSPDGTTIIFNTNIEKHNGRIWTVDLKGEVRQVTVGPSGQEDFEPTFSPDGRYIAFSRYQDDAALTDIWVIGSDGTGARNLTPGSPGFDLAPTWAVARPSQGCD